MALAVLLLITNSNVVGCSTATLTPSTTDKTSWTKPLRALTHRASIYMGILSRRDASLAQGAERGAGHRAPRRVRGVGQHGRGGPTAACRLGFRDRHASIVHELRNLPRQRFSSTLPGVANVAYQPRAPRLPAWARRFPRVGWMRLFGGSRTPRASVPTGLDCGRCAGTP